MMKKVLLVDDDTAFLRIMKEAMEERNPGVRMLTASNGQEALELLAQETVDLVVTDLRMPVMGGCDFICTLRETRPELPVLVMSGDVGPEDRQRLGGLSVLRFIEKSNDAIGQLAAFLVGEPGEVATTVAEA